MDLLHYLQNNPYCFYGWHALTVLLTAFLVWLITERILTEHIIAAGIQKIANRTRAQWDNVLSEKKLFHKLARITPGIVFYLMATFLFPGKETFILHVQKLAIIYIFISGATALFALFDIMVAFGNEIPPLKDFPLQVIAQVLKIALAFVLVLLTLALLLDKSPRLLLTGLTGLTAILMLIFKDAILGLVAGIQLSANRMLAVGDWLEMPSQNTNGAVIEISLTTVKVQNWDKTISTIPTYSLISESFKNWKGMSESGGRRIKRAIYIDMTSIAFCTPDMLEHFAGFSLITDYLEQKKKEVSQANTENHVDESKSANGRRLTNIGTFRAYMVAYLRNHPKIHDDMTFLVRQLAPTDHGLPIEIYVFCTDQVWSHYEDIQSDIFDHTLAVLPEFGLRVFQNPTGADFQEISKQDPAQTHD